MVRKVSTITRYVFVHRKVRFRWGQRNSRRTKPVVSREAKELHNRKHTRGALFREIPSSDIRKVLNKRVR